MNICRESIAQSNENLLANQNHQCHSYMKVFFQVYQHHQHHHHIIYIQVQSKAIIIVIIVVLYLLWLIELAASVNILGWYHTLTVLAHN